MQQIGGDFDAHLRIDSRNKNRRIGCKTVEHPFPESFLVLHKIIVHPHFKRNGQKQNLRTRSLVKRRFYLGQCRLTYQSVRFILNNRFIPGIEYFVFGQMLRHRTPRKQHDTNQTAC